MLIDKKTAEFIKHLTCNWPLHSIKFAYILSHNHHHCLQLFHVITLKQSFFSLCTFENDRFSLAVNLRPLNFISSSFGKMSICCHCARLLSVFTLRLLYDIYKNEIKNSSMEKSSGVVIVYDAYFPLSIIVFPFSLINVCRSIIMSGEERRAREWNEIVKCHRVLWHGAKMIFMWFEFVCLGLLKKKS